MAEVSGCYQLPYTSSQSFFNAKVTDDFDLTASMEDKHKAPKTDLKAYDQVLLHTGDDQNNPFIDV